ncbi:MAG: hypothetical protein QOE01_3347 [Actinomycetota bacterium]|nr:hypothetical protein [Actinomycetota bacterium]
MTFDVAAVSYDRFMGGYSVRLAPQLADLAAVAAGQRVLDVGAGPGALTAELVARVGAGAVCAVEPSAPFADALRARQADVDVRQAAAESLPYDDDEFDASLAQLVVHFMRDPVAGLREMARVTRPGGAIAACVWDHVGGHTPLGPFWDAVHELEPAAEDESRLAGAREGHLGELFRAAGIGDLAETVLGVDMAFASFEDWWEPFTLGVGPAGAYVARLDPPARSDLADVCRRRLGDGPLTLQTRAWAVAGRA